MNLECTYQAPRNTKKDQSLTLAINAIRRLEAKIEDLTTEFFADKSMTVEDAQARYVEIIGEAK